MKSKEMSKCISQSSLGDREDAGGCSVISPGAPEAAKELSFSVPFISCDEFASLYDFACALPRCLELFWVYSPLSSQPHMQI